MKKSKVQCPNHYITITSIFALPIFGGPNVRKNRGFGVLSLNVRRKLNFFFTKGISKLFMKDKKITNVKHVEKLLVIQEHLIITLKLFMKAEKIINVKLVVNILDNHHNSVHMSSLFMKEWNDLRIINVNFVAKHFYTKGI